MIIKSYGHRFNNRLKPLSSNGRSIVAKLFLLLKEPDIKQRLSYEWLSVDDFVHHSISVKKLIPDDWALEFTYHGGDLLFRFSLVSDNHVRRVYMTKKEFRNLNFSLVKILSNKLLS